jgi:hypothetical protein
MGYRSSVYIQIPIKQWDEFISVITDMHAERAELVDFMASIREFLDSIRMKHITQTNVFFSDYIKWYTDDAVISAIEDAVKGTVGAVFIRIGEDAEDVDWHDMSVEKTYFIRRAHITCEGTIDSLEMAVDMLRGIEAAPSDVRLEAITKLRKYLTALEEAEGITPLPDSTDFEG